MIGCFLCIEALGFHNILNPGNEPLSLRWIPLKVRAMSAKIKYQKSTYSSVTFYILLETSHSTSFDLVSP